MWEDFLEGDGGRRARTGRWMRWEDQVEMFVKERGCRYWHDVAKDDLRWQSMLEDFKAP